MQFNALLPSFLALSAPVFGFSIKRQSPGAARHALYLSSNGAVTADIDVSSDSTLPYPDDSHFGASIPLPRLLEFKSHSRSFFNNSRLEPFFKNETLDPYAIRRHYAKGNLLIVDVCSNSTNATQHVYWVESVDSPSPLGSPGPIELRGLNNCTRSFFTPGYHGNIRAGADWNGDGTKVEMSFMEQDIFVSSGISRPIVDVDVSLVDGWNGPLVCSCQKKVIVGCSADLAALGGPCPKPSSEGTTCFNPSRDLNGGAGPADPWFMPCKGGSYLYPQDDLANDNDACPSNHLVCCAGPGCPSGVNKIG